MCPLTCHMHHCHRDRVAAMHPVSSACMPGGTFYTEIRGSGARPTLSTFDTVEQLNFNDCESLTEAEFLVGFNGFVNAEQRRLTIAQEDERAMEAWAAAFPKDVLDERAFFAQKKAEHRAEKEGIHARKRFIEAQEAGMATIDKNDER
ncbi:uncharacterized protein [Lolium perenne]|uniref:uncharacterized protein n=1 Tax=Lolium perenne TaxID=4522 RepID=UPI0021F569AB|nr:uncharacterized protein LOC127333888 [Lolium perenne]